MIIVKIVLKIACTPILLVLTLVKRIGAFITTMSSVIFYLLTGIIFMTGVLSYGFELETGTECLRILAVAFVVFMIPVTENGIVDGIACIQLKLLDFI